MDTKAQVLSFFESCEEIKSANFIMATKKIKDLLKCIVNCPDLYRLFEAVTKDFDYSTAKEKCLVTANDGFYSKGYVVLPQTVGQRLAFIFCLFVEFDREIINFNDFLRKYFHDEGYYTSYQNFCNQIVDGLKNSVAQIFREYLAEEKAEKQPSRVNSYAAEIISAIEITVSAEIRRINSVSAVPLEDRECGIKILSELSTAAKAGNSKVLDALVCGYNYFLMCFKLACEDAENLIKLVAEYMRLLQRG